MSEKEKDLKDILKHINALANSPSLNLKENSKSEKRNKGSEKETK